MQKVLTHISIQLIAHMSCYMGFHIFFLVESFSAELTREGPLASMHTIMSLQGVKTLKCFTTLLTIYSLLG